MKTYIQEKNGYQLEIGLGWFTIYDAVDGVIVSTGMSINFGGSHDEMRKFAIAVFDKLIKWEVNMNYEDMSDFEVNRAVAFKIRGRDAVCVIVNKLVRIFNGNPEREEDSCWVDFDPCNNPSDAWRIITSNDINLSKHKADDYWFAFVRAEDLGVSEFKCKDSNPLRAACICFLKLKDVENSK